MKKIILTVLLVIILILSLGAVGIAGFLWYRDSHVFVEGVAYNIHARELDLTKEDISLAHYDALQAQLPDCDILWIVPFQGGKIQSDNPELFVSVLTREDVDFLARYFPKLKRLDASTCTDYAVLEELMDRLPEVEVIYSVGLGGMEAEPGVTELELYAQDYDFDTLMENLQYLPDLKSMKLRMPEISTEQIAELSAAYPEVAIACTVEILGQEYDTETTRIDLSMMKPGDVEEAAEKLSLLPGLTEVELMDPLGVSLLEKEDVKLLVDKAPDTVFHYSFDFFGTTVSTADEEISLKNVKIGDENEEQVRLLLDLVPNCKRLVLDNCKLSDEVMAQIREDYRHQTKVVWRVWFGEGGSSLTDAEIVRAVYGLVDDNCHDLVYLEDARYMDIGHNEWLDACDFVAGMKSLEYVILSGSPIKSLEPFRNCKNLKFLEISFCEYLTDASPLADCESLEMLNISNTHIVDLSPLDNLPLKTLVARMWTSNDTGINSRVSVEEQERFMAAQPDCQSYFNDHKNPYGEGWRYTEDGKGYLPDYARIRRVFRYDKDPNIPNQVGWYLQNEEEEPTE